MMPILVLPLLSGCVINSDSVQRPRDLEPTWLVTKPRLLSVRADPAEARPGEEVRFSALLVDPNDEIETVLWIACGQADGGGGFGCIDEEQEVIGIEPFQPPVYTTPSDLLEGLDEAERLEGRYINVQVTGLPPTDIDEIGDDFDFDSIDFNQIEAGYKRVVVSEATTPNLNPEVTGFLAEGNPLPPDTLLELDPGQPYQVGITLNEDLIELYEFLNSEGVVEERVEQPYITWFTTSGEFGQPFSLYPFVEVSFRAPDESGTEGTLWAVVRDRRGGQTWTSQAFIVR